MNPPQSTIPDYAIVFSHLRWNFVWQRPQHIIERLSKFSKVLFIEEPIGTNGKEGLNKIEINKNITVLQPLSSTINPVKLNTWLMPFIENWKSKPLLWFYSPALVDIIKLLPSSLIVYDCMDELSAFNGASDALVEQERELFTYADIVFTGGKSLYESKREFHNSVYCFPSSVDKSHFSKKMTGTPPDMTEIPMPRIGYYGVIDERIDYSLLKSLARKMPLVSFVLVGPFAKIDKDGVPREANIFYLGQKKYKELPGYLQNFDVAMMPFALNKATQYISPTKTLEYMAANKPIISTPIYDVERDYSKEVRISKTVDEWQKSIEYYLSEPPLRKIYREILQSNVIERNSWETTVQKMLSILSNTIIEKKNSEFQTSAIKQNQYPIRSGIAKAF